MITYNGLLHLGFSRGDFVLQDDSDGKGTYIKEWKSDKPQPSIEEMKTANDFLQAEYAKNKYQQDRLQEYPSIQELIVALYDTQDRAEIDQRRADVKKKYPKG